MTSLGAVSCVRTDCRQTGEEGRKQPMEASLCAGTCHLKGKQGREVLGERRGLREVFLRPWVAHYSRFVCCSGGINLPERDAVATE